MKNNSSMDRTRLNSILKSIPRLQQPGSQLDTFNCKADIILYGGAALFLWGVYILYSPFG